MSEHDTSHHVSHGSARTSPTAGHAPAPKDRPPASAGPDQDDRFGEGPLAVDLEARIIGRSEIQGRIQILIGVGRKHGVRIGMPGYVTAKHGRLATFQVEDADEATCKAYVDASHDQLVQGTLRVVVNPRSMH